MRRPKFSHSIIENQGVRPHLMGHFKTPEYIKLIELSWRPID